MAAGNNDAVKDEPYHKNMSNLLSFEASQDAHQKDRLPGEDLATCVTPCRCHCRCFHRRGHRRCHDCRGGGRRFHRY